MTNRDKREFTSHCRIAAKTNFLMLLLCLARFAHARYSSRMIDRFLNWGDHGKPKSGKIKSRCQPPLVLSIKIKSVNGPGPWQGVHGPGPWKWSMDRVRSGGPWTRGPCFVLTHADVHAVELPLKYFVGMNHQLESLLDQVNNIRQCSTSGCNGK